MFLILVCMEYFNKRRKSTWHKKEQAQQHFWETL